jgi:hypothetical protein
VVPPPLAVEVLPYYFIPFTDAARQLPSKHTKDEE